MLAADHGGLDAVLVTALVVLLIACLCAAVVYFGGRAVGRPDIGGAGAAITLLVGAIVALLLAVD